MLITTDEVIAQGPTAHTVDPRQLLQAIQIAEERFIKPTLCSELYYDFRDLKNVTVTDANKTDLQTKVNAGNTGTQIILENEIFVNAIEEVSDEWYKKLWYEHLWKLIAECVVYIATPTNYMQFSSAGEMLNNPKSIIGGNEGQNSVSADAKDVKWKMDKLLQDRIDPLIESMRSWLCDNKKNFSKFSCYQCPCDVVESGASNSGTSFRRKTPWVHGIYDDNKKSNCC